MRVDRKKFCQCVEKSRRYIHGSASSALQNILISGDGQRVIAENLDCRVEAELEITNYQSEIDVEHNPDFPEPDLFHDLCDLNIDQLYQLCDDYGIVVPQGRIRKLLMIREIWKQSLIGADEEGFTRKELVSENFCVDPMSLSKIINSCSEAELELKLSDYEQDGFGKGFLPSYLQVGENFQQLPIFPSQNFPMNSYNSGNFVKIAEITGKELRHICRASKDQDNLPYREVIYFDKTKIVACDGSRIHVIEKTTPVALRLMTYVVKRLSNEKTIELWNNGANILLKANGLNVYTEDKPVWFPDTDVDNAINTQFNCSVTLNSPALEKIMNQVLIMTGKDYRAVNMEFDNNCLSVSIHSTKGRFIKEDVHFLSRTAITPETFKVDAMLVRDALRCRAGILNDVEIQFGGNPKYLKLIQGSFQSVILTMK
jgi:hypothetical protein